MMIEAGQILNKNGMMYNNLNVLALNVQPTFSSQFCLYCLRPRSHGQFFFDEDYLSQKLWQ